MAEPPINGRYRLLGRLGAGGMGTVSLAEDLGRGGARVALKQVFPSGTEGGHGSEAAEALTHEFETLARLRHPNLPAVHDFGRVEGSDALFISMEYIEGRDLLTAAASLEPSAVIDVVAQVCRALEFIHTRGLVHRDLKPDNILVTGGGEEPRAVLVDFGLASAPREEGFSRGTPHYVAPEILRGEPVDRRADLYALGVVLYRLAAGRCPFEGTAREVLRGHLEGTPPRLAEAASSGKAEAPLRRLLGDALSSVVLKLLEKDPMRRYRSAAEALQALNRAAGTRHPIETAETGGSYSTWAPLVGRDGEMAAVETILDRLPQRVARGGSEREVTVVLVAGEAGTGKTRFLSEVKRRAQVRGILAAGVACAADAPAFQPVAQSLSLLGAAAPPLEPDAGAAVEMTPEGARLRAADAAVTSLARRAAGVALTLVLDDAHLADEGTLAVCEALARGAAAAPGLLLVLSYRPEEIEESALGGALGRLRRDSKIEEICLAPLDAATTGRLISGMLGLEAAPRELVDLIHRETSGNPRFVEEAVRSLIEDGTISRVDLTFRADLDALTRISFPAGVGDAIRRRLARLPAEERSLLEVLAVIGRPADRALVEEVAAAPPDATARALASLGGKRIVLEEAGDAGPLHSFANARTREAVYDGTDWERRRSLHDAVASALKARAAAGAALRHEELARHFINGSDPEAALEAALEAADRSRALGAGGDAVAFHRRALELLPAGREAERAEIHWKVGLVERDLGRDAQAAASFDESLRAATAASRRDLAARARLEKANLLVRRARSDEAIREVERAVEILGPGGDLRLLARAHRITASALARAGKVDRALEVQGRSVAAAEQAGDVAGLAAALNNLGVLTSFTGRQDEAVAILERAIRLRREIGDRHGELETASNLGTFLSRWGDLDRAVPCLESSVTLARSLSDLRALVESQVNLGHALAAAGRHDRAAASFEEAVAVAVRIGDDLRASSALDGWGTSLRTAGDADLAAEKHAQALERARRAGDAAQEIYAVGSLALDRAAAADLDGAREALRRAGKLAAAAAPPPHARLRLMEAAALTHLLAGAPKDAEASASEMAESAREAKMESEEARALLLLGSAKAALGDASAAAPLRQAVERAAARRLPEVRWRALAALAAWMERSGDAGPARSLLAEARALVEDLASRIADEEVRRRYLAAPERAALIATAPSLAEERAPAAATPLSAIYRISEIVTSAAGLDDMLTRVLDLALEIVRAERGLIILMEPEGDRQEVRAARGVEPETIADALEYSRSVVREAAAGRTLIALDAEGDQSLRRFKSVSLYQIKSLACVPMMVRDRVLGTVYLDSRRPATFFHDEDLQFLRAFANLAGAAIEMASLNARLSSENVTLRREVQDLRKAAGRRTSYQGIVGKNVRMQAVYDLLDRVSASTLPVLITGESGTGKELVARAIHFGGPRRDRRFFSENVAAIPADLLESELFGHVRGAFTGADRDRKGVFELAHGGTLFLDEIGDMTLHLQAKLLRALQDGEIRPVGGKETVRVDVRIVSATNRDLEGMVREGRFREDLYYRLNVVRIGLPPLRERKEDVPLLVEHFLERTAESGGAPRKRIDISALQLLLRYDWPGNVRELENEILKLAVLTEGPVITQQDVSRNRELMDKLTRLEGEGEKVRSLADMEKRQIERALTEAGGNRARAAEILGISRATIYRKIREYGISA